MKLLTMAHANAKTAKNGKDDRFHTAILHLAPYNKSGYQVCPAASNGCAMACLNTAGRGRFDNVQQARTRKTKLFFQDRELFLTQLIDDIGLLTFQANKLDKIPVVRLNGTSDIDWENVLIDNFCNIFEYWPNVQFYDYTKRIDRLTKLVKNPYDNYHITFSNSENNDRVSRLALELGFNVAVVFRNELPELYWGYPVVNGDDTDLRFIDNKNSIVGLKAKGDAKKDKSGFVKDAKKHGHNLALAV